MAPRTHLTDLGSIANVDLTELGAGKEGWLDNPNLLCALDTNSLAIANRYYILVLEWSNASGTASFRVKIRPNLSPIEAEYVSALEWLVFDDIRVIAIGTSCGYFLIYSLGGDLIHKQVPSIRLLPLLYFDFEYASKLNSFKSIATYNKFNISAMNCIISFTQSLK